MTPAGGSTVAVLVIVPRAEGTKVPLTMKVAVPPASRLIGALTISPVPEATPLEPLE